MHLMCAKYAGFSFFGGKILEFSRAWTLFFCLQKCPHEVTSGVVRKSKLVVPLQKTGGLSMMNEI